MATWTYEITVSGDHYMKDGSAFSATIRRTSPASVSDIGLYSIDGSCTVKSNSRIQTYANDVCLSFGSYFWIGTLSKNQSDHSIVEDGYDLDSSILNVGPGGADVTISAEHPGGSGNGCYLKHNLVFTISIGVNSKYSSSSISCGSPVDFGNTSFVSFSNPQLGVLNHKITWKVNDTYQYETTTATGASSAVYQIPTSWLASCPNRTSIECTVTVQTLYHNNSIGDPTSKVIALSVPNSIVPSIGGFTSEIYNDTSKEKFATSKGVYIQNLCGAKFTVSSVSAGTGSTISSIEFSSTSEDDGSQKWNEYTIDKFGHSGKMNFTVTVKDGRGRAASATLTINVIAYNLPVISSYNAFRCTATGIGSEKGTYASIYCSANVSPVTINGSAANTMKISGYYYVYTTGTPSLVTAISDMTSGKVYIVGGGNLSSSSTYYARFIVTDAMGGTATTDTLISSAAYAIHVKNGGTGVAFGKTSEIQNAVEINSGWNLFYKGFQMPPIVYSATNAPSNPVAGLIWLKKK